MYSLSSSIFILLIAITKTTNGVHFNEPGNLVTDPNGFSFFKDRFHLFYELFRLDTNESTFFERLNWGHATSFDLLKWEVHKPIIGSYENDENVTYKGEEVKNVSRVVPFSGSSIVDSRNVTGLLKRMDEPILMVYSSISKFLFGVLDEETGVDFIFSTVYMFYSYDGYNFTRYEKPMVNRSLTVRNFRDPSVFEYGPNHFNLLMVENMKFAVLKSNDLLNWVRVSELKSENLVPESVVEVETPNLIEIGDQTFLVFSANREVKPVKFPFYCTTRYLVGNFDGYRFEVENNQSREFDGPDFYAVSINRETGNLIAMINNWKYLMYIKFNGTLCYPRHLNKMNLNNLTYLTQEFIKLDVFSERQIEVYGAIEEISYDFKDLNKAHYIKIKLKNEKCDDNLDFQIIFEGTNNTVIIGYNSATNEFYLDRSKSIKVNEFFNDVHKFKSKFKKILKTNQFDIDIILDVNTVEFLTENGLVAITALHLNHKIPKNLILRTNQNYKVDLMIKKYGG